MFTFVKISRTYTTVHEQQLHSIIEMNFTDDLLLGSETNFFFREQSAEPENKDKTSQFAILGAKYHTESSCVFLFLFIFKCLV